VLQNFKGKDRLLICLGQALAGDVVANLIVFDGVKLFIPVKTSTVTVLSEVRRQGSCVYQKNFDVEDYLSLSCRHDLKRR
jgi:polysaccharide export outer membrane protein